MTSLLSRMALAPVPGLALLRRELLTTLRGFMPFVALVTMVSGVLLVMFAIFPQLQTINSGASFSAALLDMISAGLAIAAFVFVSPVAALSIAGERERGTYDMLHLTLISPRALLVAKFLNAITFFLLLCVALLPVVGVVFFFVGIEPGHFVRRFVGVFLVAIHCTNVGIMCSAGNHRGAVAVLAAYLILLTTAAFVGAAVFFSNLAAFVIIAIFGIPCYRVALRNVAAFLPRAPMEIDTSSRVEVILPGQKPVPYTIAYGPERPPVPDHRNPILWREMQWGIGGRGPQLNALLWGSLGINLFFMLISIEDKYELNRAYVGLMSANMLLMLLVLPVLCAGSVTREVELGNMDLLRTTLLGPGEILHGKILAAIITVLPLLAGPLAITGLAIGVASFRVDLVLPYIAGFATMALYVGLTVIGGVCFSAFCRRTTQAILLTYVLLAGTTVGLPLVLAPVFDDQFGLFSPGMAYFHWLFSIGGNDNTSLNPRLNGWIWSMVVYVIAVWGMYVLAHHQFATRRMQDA